MDWVDITGDPVAPEVHAFLLQRTRDAKRVATASYPEFLKSRVAGRSVLDIGMVEHQASNMTRPDWVHGLIRSVCGTTLGIDIIESAIADLASRGYDVALVDATSEVDLGRRFEVVHIGDVIEHVDSPVAMLRFAERHLVSGGEILVRTPNPWWLPYIVRNHREGVLVANAEHVSWVSPTMAVELARRSGLVLQEYWLLAEPTRSPVRRMARWALRGSELLAPNYLYVLGRAE